MNPDNKQAIELACSMVYEKLTGKCWHKHDEVNRYAHNCLKCGEYTTAIINVPLATSLDAWAEHIWPVMNKMQQIELDREVETLLIQMYITDLKPIYILKAALRVLGLYEQWEIAIKERS